MSTSEFDGQEQRSEFELFGLTGAEDFLEGLEDFPADFSECDLEFAQELEHFFALEEEEVPPLFVQTLLESADPRFQAVEVGFEKKTYARVFRRLKLKRRLFRSSHSAHRVGMSRPFMAIGLACLLFMVLTAVYISPSFASGFQYLWAGAHSGVLQVKHYPTALNNARPAKTVINALPDIPEQMTVMQAQQRLHFPIFWPQYIPEKYSHASGDIFIYKGDPAWSDGPIVVSTFYNARPGLSPRQILICEFKPQGKVLQVVQDGAAQQLKIGRDGSAAAVYVQGQWNQNNASTPTWVYSERSQLIYENDRGVVFWIVGDERDGIDKEELQSIATSLSLLDTTRTTLINGHPVRVVKGVDNEPSFLANDVIYMDNPDNPNGPIFKLVGAPQAPSTTIHNHGLHGDLDSDS
ncbi:hypothetical protein [Tengunoibacter tsumagoiensis]|uniref:Uncharacterized protein n=1 Tax=Tengunoibacter tsumagoiensis TaxID=2014871 RepID=A0A401ZWS7_9CHLR|nr:hypothetical protein [Tengunoibacter tsumagoiensis]GCE11325.1 hypothetical protein KTT_11840 [Tengunoibacter tsumagoiensis]